MLALFTQTMSTAVLSVNCVNMMGQTPLHKACLLGQRVLVEMFVRHGAFLNIGTKENNQTPLHLACQYNQKDVRKGRWDAGVVVEDIHALGEGTEHVCKERERANRREEKKGRERRKGRGKQHKNISKYFLLSLYVFYLLRACVCLDVGGAHVAGAQCPARHQG